MYFNIKYCFAKYVTIIEGLLKMEIINSIWFWPVIFILSLLLIIYTKRMSQKRVSAQCVITLSVIMIIFYCVCFLSGICTILNFIFRWLI